MNSQRYINDVLNGPGFDFYEALIQRYGDAVWQQDNASYHASKMSVQYLKALGFQLLEWPAQSPDLNPIENLWRLIKIRISQRRYRIHTIDEMEQIIQEEWNALKPTDWKKITESMSKRCELVIRAKGGAIKY